MRYSTSRRTVGSMLRLRLLDGYHLSELSASGLAGTRHTDLCHSSVFSQHRRNLAGWSRHYPIKRCPTYEMASTTASPAKILTTYLIGWDCSFRRRRYDSEATAKISQPSARTTVPHRSIARCTQGSIRNATKGRSTKKKTLIQRRVNKARPAATAQIT